MVTVSLLAGSEPAVRPVFHFDMDTDDATQVLARTDEQHPWLEYSVWQGQEWVRIYTPGQLQMWHPEEAVPDPPDNSFREWKRVTDPDDGTCEPGQAWTIRDWQHKAINRFCPAMNLSPPIMLRINHLLKCKIRTSSGSRRCSPTPHPYLTVITRHLCSFRLSSMAAHVLLTLEILRPRLLSGLVRSVLPAAVDILVDVKS